MAKNLVIYHENSEFDTFIAQKALHLISRYHCNKSDKLQAILTDAHQSEPMRQNLQADDYLLIICSTRTKDSQVLNGLLDQWKAAFGGKWLNHVFTLLIDGEPIDSFPVKLRYLEITDTDSATGEERTHQVEIEPLAADIRSKSRKKSLKILNTEILRIIAPLYGTTFDRLYHIGGRRRLIELRKKLLASALLATYLIILFTSISYHRHVKEDNYNRIKAEAVESQKAYLAETDRVNRIYEKLKSDILSLYDKTEEQDLINTKMDEYEAALFPADADPADYLSVIFEESDPLERSFINDDGTTQGTIKAVLMIILIGLIFFTLMVVVVICIVAASIFIKRSLRFSIRRSANKLTYSNWTDQLGKSYFPILKMSLASGFTYLKKSSFLLLKFGFIIGLFALLFIGALFLLFSLFSILIGG